MLIKQKTLLLTRNLHMLIKQKTLLLTRNLHMLIKQKTLLLTRNLHMLIKQKTLLLTRNLHMLIKQKTLLLTRNLAPRTFGELFSVPNKDKSAIPPLFNSPKVLSSASDKAKLCAEKFSKNSNHNYSGNHNYSCFTFYIVFL